MPKLSPYITIKRVDLPFAGLKKVYAAFWVGTSNRVKNADGELTPQRVKRADLVFDLLNNPKEPGVIS